MELTRFVLDRIRCRLHPYIIDGCGWRRYPPHLAQVLREYEPLHVIALTDVECIIDGAAVASEESLREKRDAVLNALIEEFGEASEKREAGFNLELFKLDPYMVVAFYEGRVWFISLCIKKDLCPERFAFIADEGAPCLPMQYMRGKIICVAVSNRIEATFSISGDFFADPKPENAALLGDLFFLSQMSRDWTVTREIKPDLSCSYIFFFHEPYESIARILRKTPGVKSLVRYIYVQALLDEEHLSEWRRLLKLLEGEGCASESMG